MRMRGNSTRLCIMIHPILGACARDGPLNRLTDPFIGPRCDGMLLTMLIVVISAAVQGGNNTVLLHRTWKSMEVFRNSSDRHTSMGVAGYWWALFKRGWDKPSCYKCLHCACTQCQQQALPSRSSSACLWPVGASLIEANYVHDYDPNMIKACTADDMKICTSQVYAIMSARCRHQIWTLEQLMFISNKWGRYWTDLIFLVHTLLFTVGGLHEFCTAR